VVKGRGRPSPGYFFMDKDTSSPPSPDFYFIDKDTHSQTAPDLSSMDYNIPTMGLQAKRVYHGVCWETVVQVEKVCSKALRVEVKCTLRKCTGWLHCNKHFVFKLSFMKMLAVEEIGQALESEWWGEQDIC